MAVCFCARCGYVATGRVAKLAERRLGQPAVRGAGRANLRRLAAQFPRHPVTNEVVKSPWPLDGGFGDSFFEAQRLLNNQCGKITVYPETEKDKAS